jgi:SAM-dependent methyltransferase
MENIPVGHAQTKYDAAFYQDISKSSGQAAAEIVPELVELLAPRSVADIGCGTGAWLAAFKNHDVQEIYGLDGPWVDADHLAIPRESFQKIDLSQPFVASRRFDLAMSLEVAEHLPGEAADGFIRSLTSFSDCVLFSAAIPHQGGIDHLNEQWPEYWEQRFSDAGYVACDLRPMFWNRPGVAWWYLQNMLVFVRSGRTDILQRLNARVSPARPWPLSVVHPRQYQAVVDKLHGAEYLSQRRFMELLAAIGPSAFRAIRRRITKR